MVLFVSVYLIVPLSSDTSFETLVILPFVISKSKEEVTTLYSLPPDLNVVPVSLRVKSPSLSVSVFCEVPEVHFKPVIIPVASSVIFCAKEFFSARYIHSDSGRFLLVSSSCAFSSSSSPVIAFLETLTDICSGFLYFSSSSYGKCHSPEVFSK